MSLDVALYEIDIHVSPELCFDCIALAPDEHAHMHHVFDANITHNLGAMAQAVGVYEACWHPGKLLDAWTAARMREQEVLKNWHGDGGVYALEATLPVPRARDLCPILQEGLALLVKEPARFMYFEPENKWGTYDGLVKFLQNYVSACLEYPDAIVKVNR